MGGERGKENGRVKCGDGTINELDNITMFVVPGYELDDKQFNWTGMCVGSGSLGSAGCTGHEASDSAQKTQFAAGGALVFVGSCMILLFLWGIFPMLCYAKQPNKA